MYIFGSCITPLFIYSFSTLYINITISYKQHTAANNLQTIASANSNLLEFTFYTDRSVIDLGNSRCSMGIVWIQVFNNQVIYQFSAQIQDWPFSYKAKLVAILSAICTCPRNSTIYIYTDSQSIISKYKSLTYSKQNFNKIYSYNYWPIWHTLLNLIQTYSYTITLHKVSAHSIM